MNYYRVFFTIADGTRWFNDLWASEEVRVKVAAEKMGYKDVTVYKHEGAKR